MDNISRSYHDKTGDQTCASGGDVNFFAYADRSIDFDFGSVVFRLNGKITQEDIERLHDMIWKEVK